MLSRSAGIAILCGLLLSLVAAAGPEASDLGGGKVMRKREEIRIRDPFILPVPEEKRYYLYGTTRAMPDAHGGARFETFVSEDLENWEGPITVFEANEEFWGTRDFWAAEVHRYKGKYYLFGTFSTDKVLRATQILVSDSPRGPFKPLTDRPVTPFGWQCLDGTLFVDEEKKPWIVFCHEWEQCRDGEICAMPLTEDLRYPAGKPVLLFRASEAPWIVQVPWAVREEKPGNYITDGPFLYRTRDGQLLMLWSSFGKKGYVQALARSKSGKITGPWIQEKELLFDEDGGHGMVFRTFEGRLMLSLHAPNSGGRERPRLFPLRELGGPLIVENSAGGDA